MSNYIIVDLDGTLADTKHRQHYLKQEPKDWNSFNNLCHQDPCNEWCKLLMRKFFTTFGRGEEMCDVIIVSGRTEDVKGKTLDWLDHNEIDYDEIYMRKSGDFRDDRVIKKEFYEKDIYPNYKKKPLFVVEDRRKVVEFWREMGIVCLECYDHRF